MALNSDAEIKTWCGYFSNTETGDIKRPKLVIFVKDTNQTTPAYEPLGYKQESGSVSNNYDEEAITDVLGNKYNDIKDKDESIELSEYRTNKDKSKFLNEAQKLTIAGLEKELKNYTLLFVYEWLTRTVDNAVQYFGREVEGCTLVLDNLGGQDFTTADVAFKGIGRGKMGYVTYTGTPKVPTFTEGTISAGVSE